MNKVIDNYVEEAKKRPIREIVKDPEWQKVRVSLVGQWTKRSDWCVKQLRKYIEPISKATNDELRIIMNYLSSSGFRTGKIHNTPKIRKLRKEISDEMTLRKSKGKWY
jgi:hypothetical protein